MAKLVAEMTAEELREVVGSAVEKIIVELLGDPDAGLEIREHVRERLLRQKRAVARGARGEPLENVVKRQSRRLLQAS
jgi:hypothetical protein